MGIYILSTDLQKHLWLCLQVWDLLLLSQRLTVLHHHYLYTFTYSTASLSLPRSALVHTQLSASAELPAAGLLLTGKMNELLNKYPDTWEDGWGGKEGRSIST